MYLFGSPIWIAAKIFGITSSISTYTIFSFIHHWTRDRINNTVERLKREIKRRTKAIGASPDGQGTLMPVCAGLSHVAGSQWGTKPYMNMDHLFHMETDNKAGRLPDNKRQKLKL